jgi:alpha-mannosidase
MQLKRPFSPFFRRITLACISCLAIILAPGSQVQSAEIAAPAIKEIILVHFSHTDVGFTDSPSVCRELYRRYLDIAVDAVLDSMKGPANKRFFWTAEATMPVNDWWQAATAARRNQFLEAVHSGQLEISALACNNTPFMNAAQWQTMVHWIPEDLWKEAQPKVAIQNDVNGLPRAAALALLDRGIHYLFTGINEDSGGVPFRDPQRFGGKCPMAGACLSG